MKKILLITLGCILGLYQPLNAQDVENVVNGHEYVDLALPSGLKWATCNVGASKPEACGSYFAWGETKLKEEYTSKNSLTYGKKIDDISGNVQYDVAAANWGEGWRMPTKDEMQELIDNCDWEWTKQNNVKGYKVTGVNGNSIFIPETGLWEESTFYSGSCVSSCYWSSSVSGGNSDAYYLSFSNSSLGVNDKYRYLGYSIRPIIEVMEKPAVLVSVENYTDLIAIIKTYVSSSAAITERGFYYGTNPEPAETDNKVVSENEVGYIGNALINLTPNTTYYIKSYATNSEGTSYSEVVSFTTLEKIEYEYVDLGLPSGLKWATHNIGATSPSEYGNYYAWGEVVTKETYTQENSLTYDKPMDDISGTEYDAATINWGGDWRMPTRTEMQELIDNCTWTWTTQKGVSGYKVTSKLNSNYIFLPAAGYRDRASLNNAGVSGNYWSSSPNKYIIDNIDADYLNFYSSSHNVSNYGRDLGNSIRPVRE